MPRGDRARGQSSARDDDVRGLPVFGALRVLRVSRVIRGIRGPGVGLGGTPLKRKVICRTFSDCTTGPRMGLVSGCFPLDPFYLAHEQGARLRDAKAPTRS